MARARRKNSYLILATVLLVALVLALTNPGTSDFKLWTQTSAKNETNKKTGFTFLGDLSGAVAGVASSAYTRANFGLFSVYKSRNGKGVVIHSYLGIARTFISLK